jgi:Ca2+-binding RTX toxin-like protein
MPHPIRRAGASAAVLLATAAALPAAAGAASSLSVSGDTITLADGAGERNYVTVNHGNNPGAVASVDDQAGVVAAPPCFEYVTGYICPTQVRPTYVLQLGAGDDFATVINSMAAGTHSELRGEDGNDQLWSDEGSDTLDGGAGDDELVTERDTPSPGDIAIGGPGTDHLQLAGAVVSEMVATLDGKADDGAPGQGDNYMPDIENVTGAQTASNTLIGNDGPNIVIGQAQADRLTGAGGRDQLDGSGGPDAIDALDGAGGDRVECGEGADVAAVDAGDVVAAENECERLTWAPGLASTKLRRGAGRVAARLSCPRASKRTCRGAVRLTSRGGKKLASGSYRVKRGKRETVRLRLRGKPPRRAVLFVAPRGATPAAGRAVTIR